MDTGLDQRKLHIAYLHRQTHIVPSSSTAQVVTFYAFELHGLAAAWLLMQAEITVKLAA